MQNMAVKSLPTEDDDGQGLVIRSATGIGTEAVIEIETEKETGAGAEYEINPKVPSECLISI